MWKGGTAMRDVQFGLIFSAFALVAIGVVVLGYHLGRAHAAWRDVSGTRSQVPKLRRVAWARTRGVAGGIALVVVILAVALTDAVH
jgi:hypothetical protein